MFTRPGQKPGFFVSRARGVALRSVDRGRDAKPLEKCHSMRKPGILIYACRTSTRLSWGTLASARACPSFESVTFVTLLATSAAPISCLALLEFHPHLSLQYSSNADKRRSVELALGEWPELSDREIARICCVNDHLVADARKTNCGNPAVEQPTTRIGADGKRRKMPARKAPTRKQSPTLFKTRLKPASALMATVVCRQFRKRKTRPSSLEPDRVSRSPRKRPPAMAAELTVGGCRR